MGASRIHLDDSGRAPLVPGGVPIFGHAPRLATEPVEFMRACREKYGDVFRLKEVGGTRTYLLNPLDYAEYFKNTSMRFLEVGSDMAGRVFDYTWADAEKVDPEFVSHQISTMMKGDPLHAMTERMQLKLERLLFEMPAGEWQERDLFDWLGAIVFEAGTEAIFGDETYSPEVRAAYDKLDANFGYLALGVPRWMLRGVRRAQRDLAEAALQRGPAHAEILDARDEHFMSKGVPPAITSHFDSALLWAAQANTMAAAAWTVLFLLRDLGAYAAVGEEVRGVVGPPPSEPGARLLSRQDLKDLVQVESAITEMNRLTTAPSVPRRAFGDTALKLHDGNILNISKGDELGLFPPSAHRDPEIFSDPDTFVFDRFVPEEGRRRKFSKNGQPIRFNVIPFGGGVSMCPGRFFAINEFKIILASFIHWFDLELLDPDLPAFDYTRTGFGTLPPTRDVRIRVRRRSA